ncbi:MAG: hypothetical protein SOR61_02060 [Evtepia sp.]|uniref:hypothetical protein n=1 Tax=Evtepia sp. TaxID=2773933 RepID=UPI002A7500CD|nr:hypothetical protein [Evtepia sp.]MDY3013982.1 hypothetical protein [Evtepia sp.]
MKRTKAGIALLALLLGLSACGKQGAETPEPPKEDTQASALELYQKAVEKLQEGPVEIERTGTMDSEAFRIEGLTFTEEMQAEGLGTAQLRANGTYEQENEDREYTLTYQFPTLSLQKKAYEQPWIQDRPYYLELALPGEADHEGTVSQKENGTTVCTFTYSQEDVGETNCGILNSALPIEYTIYWARREVAPEEEGVQKAEVVATLDKEGNLRSVEMTYEIMGGIQDVAPLTGTTRLTFEEGEPQEGNGPSQSGQEKPEAQPSLWEEMPEEFVFSSGAGGWATMLNIADDGSFTGKYFDGDLGDVGDAYPNGTTRICTFKGKFSQPKRVEGGVYSTRLESLEMDGTPGEEYYQEGVRYIRTEPFGLVGADEFLIYKPGLPVTDLPGPFRDWMRGIAPLGNEKYLPYYGLYNVSGEMGFGAIED